GRLVYYATEERRGAPLRASVVMSQARRPGGRLPVTRVAPWFDHAHALWQDRAATADAASVLYQRRRPVWHLQSREMMTIREEGMRCRGRTPTSYSIPPHTSRASRSTL